MNAGDLPMIVRVYRNVSPGRETFISCKGTFAPEIDALLTCPMVVDRWNGRGPLAGLLSTLAVMTSPLVFAVAGDAPCIDTTVIERIAAAWEPGIEAVVPRHPGGIEPLAALYDRVAFLREGRRVLASGRGALRLVIERLAVKFGTFGVDPRVFSNVNTAADYAALREVIE